MNVVPRIMIEQPNGLRYLRWGRDGEAVQPEKGSGVENCWGLPQNPQRQVHALLAGVFAYQNLTAKRILPFVMAWVEKHERSL